MDLDKLSNVAKGEGKKIIIFRLQPMKKESVEHWGKQLRKHVKRLVYKHVFSGRVSYEVLGYKRNLIRWLHAMFGPGTYSIGGWRKPKPRGPRKFTLPGNKNPAMFSERLVRVEIISDKDAVFFKNLFPRFKFWREREGEREWREK